MKKLLILFLLTGCVGVPLKTLVEVARLDPMTVDPAEIIIVVDTTPGISLQTKGAKLVIGSKKSDGTALEEVFLLPAGDPIQLGAIPATDLSRRYFYLTDVDVERVLKTRDTIARWKEEDPKTRGTLAVSARPCLDQAISEDDPLMGKIWAKFRHGGPFVVIQKLRDFRSEIPADAELPWCDDLTL